MEGRGGGHTLEFSPWYEQVSFHSQSYFRWNDANLQITYTSLYPIHTEELKGFKCATGMHI